MFRIICEEVLVGLTLWLAFGRGRQRALNALVPMELLRYVGGCARRVGWLALVSVAANVAVGGWMPMRAEGLGFWAYAGCCLAMLGLGFMWAVLLHHVITLARYASLRWHAYREHQASAYRVTRMPKTTWTAAELANFPPIDAPRWKGKPLNAR